ncbi:MAG: hypothetical protein JNM85_07785 [Chthonomonas sp.]|nr:hypothetical protein [Chthonomonas sp.]
MPQSPPARSDNTALKVVLVVLVFVLVPCIVLSFIGYNFLKKGVSAMSESIMPTAACAANFEYVRDSALAYAGDHNGALPPSKDWQAALEPYYRKLSARLGESKEFMGTKFEIKPLPKDKPWSCETGPKTPNTGITFNLDVAGKKLSDITNPESTVLFFETPEVRLNAATPYVPQPKSTAPKIIAGEARDWFVVNIKGEMKMDDSKIRFRTGPESKTGVRIETGTSNGR